MTTNNIYKETLAAIKKSKKLREKNNPAISELIPDDIYEYTYKKPDLSYIYYIQLHGKCLSEKAKIEKDGYIFTQVRHIPKSNKKLSRTICNKCNTQLNPREAKIIVEEQKQ